MKKAFQVSFLQLLFIFIIVLALSKLNVIAEYAFHFECFSLIIALFGISIFSLQRKEKITVNSFHVTLILLVLFVLAILLRVLPYLDNQILLGYDSGIYKYVFELYQNSLPAIIEENLPFWIMNIHEPGLFSFSTLFFLFGSTSFDLLQYAFIFFSAFLVFPIFILTRKYSNDIVALMASLFYVVSYSQFQVFALMYYRNIVALLLFLIGFYLLEKKDNIFSFSLIMIALGFMHRPTFLLFFIVFLVHSLINLKDKEQIINNVKIMIISGISLVILYYFRFYDAIVMRLVKNVANSSGGTFMSLSQYQIHSLVYLPLSLLGIFYFIQNRKFKNPLFLWLLVNSIIVVFQLVFFNRYIIHLDLIMIIMAGFGLYSIFNMKNYRKYSVFLVALIVLLSSYFGFQTASETNPLISEKDLDAICWLSNNTEEDAYVMATFSNYSPWILGYSDRKIIAPGLFRSDNWTTEQWVYWWETNNIQEFKNMLNDYERPLYIHVGKTNRFLNKTHFEDSCFEEVFNDNRTHIYNYLC